MKREHFKKAQKIANLINVLEDLEVTISEHSTGLDIQINRITIDLKEKIKLREFAEEIKTQLKAYFTDQWTLLNKEFDQIGEEESEVQDG